MKLRRKTGRGTLHIIGGLLISSAVVRIGAEGAPAFADDAVDEPVEVAEQMPPQPDTGALLAALRERDKQLTTREQQLRDRIQALRVAEAEIDEKLVALRAAEENLAATIALADAAAATDLGQLTTVYENMKPKEAAALFEEMPPQFAAGFLGLMQPESAALIMTQLQPETAYSFSVVLAGRNANVPTE